MKHTGLALVLLTLALAACREKKHITTAKGNAIAYGKARCSCEKLKKKDPPGDLAQCSEEMAKATRYLKINYEFNSFSDADKAEIDKAGNDAFTRCMAEP